MGAVAFIDNIGVGTSVELATQDGSRCTATGVVPGGAPGLLARQPVPPALFVDPQNVTGHASDSNNGQTAGAPLLTTDRLNSILFLSLVSANTTITYLSDDTPGAVVDVSTLAIDAAFSLVFQGTPQVLHTGGSLNAGTIAINPNAPGGGQRQVVHTTDLATFEPYVVAFLGGPAPHGCYLIMTAGPNVGTSSWIVSATTPASPSMSRPVTPDASAGTLSIGDGYAIQRGSVLAITGNMSVGPQASVAFNDFAFTGGSGPTTNGSFLPIFTRCSFDVGVFVQGGYIHCFAGGDYSVGAGQLQIVAGVWLVIGGNTGDVVMEVTGDTYATGTFTIAANANGFGNLSILAGGIGSGIQLQDFTLPASPLTIGNSAPICTGANGQALIWGNGNTGPGVLFQQNASFTVPAQVATAQISVTGTGGDFAALGPDGTNLTTARTWNDGTGTYSAPIACTWANFYNPASLNFQAHFLASNAHLVGA